MTHFATQRSKAHGDNKSEDVLGKKMNSSDFKLQHHQGVITGNLWIKNFIEENPKYTVMTMDW